MSERRHGGDGDGWVECACGQRHWGRFGSAGLLVTDPRLGVLLQHRVEWSHHGGTWGIPGGARSSKESALQGALREAEEEAAVPPALVTPRHAWVEDHGTWSYATVVAERSGDFTPFANDAESLEITWVPIDEVDQRPLHPAFGAAWPAIRRELNRRLVLVVDAANVVGSRPDGWWRDRAGAAARLRDRLSSAPPWPAAALNLAADSWWPETVLVVEGRASGIDTDDTGAVRVVRAQGHGDDTIVRVAAEAVKEAPDDHVVVVTADRELRERIESAGASSLGPGTLLRHLDA